MSIEPDTKDWTWVIERACAACGWDPEEVTPDQLADLLHENTRSWYAVLADADFAVRPAPHVWSRLEYACHVRDVHGIFTGRVHRMLEEEAPTFDPWDQDATAEEEDYGLQDPALVGTALVEQAAEAAALYSTITGEQWQRGGRRSDNVAFTIEALGKYHLHEVIHHLWDVSISPGPGAPGLEPS